MYRNILKNVEYLFPLLQAIYSGYVKRTWQYLASVTMCACGGCDKKVLYQG